MLLRPQVFAYLCLPLLWANFARAQAPKPAGVPVAINFAAEVNGEKFACNKTYAQVGSNKVSWQPQDLRFYVSEVALLRADGSKIPVALAADDTWQTKQVALLDFEDRTGTCQNGTPATNTQVRGTVASDAGAVGIQFTLAVPFALNHADASTQGAPLDQAGLFWGWQMGYKFLSVEGKVNGGAAHTLHLGSTGCSMLTPTQVKDCTARNEPVVRLAKFDPKTQVVVADVGRLFANSQLGRGKNAPTGFNAPGASCMSEHNNANCTPIFKSLGLVPGYPQTFLRVK